MAKRTIIECDLTKAEIEDEETVFTLKIAKKGKRNPQTFELSAEAAEKLLAQLNGRNELPEDWTFSNPGALQYPPGVRGGEGRSSRRRTLADLEDEPDEQEPREEDDTRFVAEKKASLREAGVLGDEPEEGESPEERQSDGPVAKAMGAKKGGCRHMNKGRIQTTLRKGKRVAYRKCMDCRKDIPEMTAEARSQYMSGKAPKGVNIRDL